MTISPLVYELLNISYIWYGIYLWVYFIKHPFKQLDFLSQNNYRQKKIEILNGIKSRHSTFPWLKKTVLTKENYYDANSCEKN